MKKQPKSVPPHEESSAQNQNPNSHSIFVTCSLPPVTDEEKADKQQESARNIRKFRLEVAGFCVLLFYTFFTALMYFATRDAANAAKNAAIEAKMSREQAQVALNTTVDQFRLEQRAWLAVDGYRFVADGGIDIVIEFSNSGKTPAFELTDYHAYQITGRNGRPNFPAHESPTDFIGSLPPGGKRIIRMSRLPIEKEVGEIGVKGKERTKDLFLFGTIWYKDAFGKPHYTQFCAMSFADACPFHNDTDESKH